MREGRRKAVSDFTKRLSDDELRETFLSPMVSVTETTAAIALRFEVTRARREEDALRAENERLREAIERGAFWLESQRFDGTSPETFVARAASLRAAAEKKGGDRGK